MEKGNGVRNYKFTNMSLESDEPKFKRSRFTRGHIIVLVIVGVALLALGILIGYFIGESNQPPETKPNGNPSSSSAEAQRKREIDYILQKLNKDNIRDNLRVYADRPRNAGSEGGYELVRLLAETWKRHGLDSVRVTPYDVLLSYPNTSNPNKVQLIEDNKVVFQSALKEEKLGHVNYSDEIVPPFNAYAVAGLAEGELVYVNYGRIEDFDFLVNNKSMDLNGKIAIARYGKIFRGDKVKLAQRFGCAGIIMYTDPSDFNINSGPNSTVYPDSWWMPGTGVQRGTVGNDGDALTPFYPAKDYAYRMKKEDVEGFTIPAQPIGYDDARPLLAAMVGEEAPPSWRGTLNITYRLGPGYNKPNLKVRLEVNNYEEVRTINNVIGYVKGSEEPDRYVLLGNHHDAWVFGAIDPLSGTAVSTEITRVLGQMIKEGMRPRRTIVLCAWGAEEHGLLGSVEWVEEYMKVLYERAVAYLNVDYACDYNYNLIAGVSPLLQDPLYHAAKQVPNPDPKSDKKTIYSIWLERDSMDDHLSPQNKVPSVYYSLGSGSDMASFYQRAGVPSLDMWYDYDYNLWDILSYPVYHSQYETVYLYEKFIDPGYNYTLGLARLWLVLAWNLANDEVLTFDTRRYATAISSFVRSLEKEFKAEWERHNITFTDLNQATMKLNRTTTIFQSKVDQIRSSSSSELEKRMINDKLIQFERAFIDPEGLPGRRIYKHVMFAPSQYDSYSDNSFPGIVDTMHDIRLNSNTNSKNVTALWDIIRQQVSVAVYTILSAANTLEDIGL